MTIAAITTITGVMTITAVITIAETTTIVTTMITIGTMIIVVTIIATTITPTDDTREITKETIGPKTYTKNDGDHSTTTVECHALHGPTRHDPRSNKNDNWYR